MDFWPVFDHLRWWLGGNMVDIPGNHGFGFGGCRSIAEGWLGCERKHGAPQGLTSLRTATEPVMLGTLGIRKSHPPRTSCTALLTSRVDDEAIKAGSQPLSIRTSTLKSNYCTTLSRSWKRPRKVDNTLKDKSAVLGRKRHRLCGCNPPMGCHCRNMGII